jgi:hypothetical protein
MCCCSEEEHDLAETDIALQLKTKLHATPGRIILVLPRHQPNLLDASSHLCTSRFFLLPN